MSTRPTRTAVAGLLLAGVLAGCATPTAPSASPISAGASVAPSTETPNGSPSPSSSASDDGDTGAPTGDTGRVSNVPGLGGVPDPATLPTPGTSPTTPNLGDSNYVQPTTILSGLPESPVLSAKYAGVKAALIQKKLGLAREPGGTYIKEELNADVVAAIKEYQADHGIDPSGMVGKETWASMFPDTPWEIDRWRTTPALPLDASSNARIEQMIVFIRSQIGAPYLWGGAGPKKYGYDCSGLMLQAMYSAGLDPAPINVVDHQRPDYPTAKKLYNYSGFKHVPASKAKRGDLLFFGLASDSKSVTHVALFLGNGWVLESITSLGVSQDRYYTSFRDGKYIMRADAVRLVG